MQSELTSTKLTQVASDALTAYNRAENVKRHRKGEPTLTKRQEIDRIIIATCGGVAYNITEEYPKYPEDTSQKRLFSVDDESGTPSNSNMDKPIAQGGK